MGLRNCERCGRLFSGADALCPACHEKDREEYERVRAYLQEHPGASVAEVSGAAGVNVSRIHAWVRQGRLKMTVTSPEGAVTCERCGTPIESGRFCPRCLSELARGLQQATRASPTPAAPTSEPRSPAPPERPPPSSVEPNRPRVHIIRHILRRRGQ